MSAAKSSDRCWCDDLPGRCSACIAASTEYVPMARFPAGHMVLEIPSLREVDRFNTRSAAEYAARLLNSGQAHIDPHAVLGCKVVQS